MDIKRESEIKQGLIKVTCKIDFNKNNWNVNLILSYKLTYENEILLFNSYCFDKWTLYNSFLKEPGCIFQ